MAWRFLCGVPKDECEGAFCMGNQSMGKSLKAHGSPEQAFNCYKHYLLRQGYTKVGEREFRAPERLGGYVTVLNKKSKFGGRLRAGKSGEKSSSSGNRFMPKTRGKRCAAGIIV